MLETIKDVPTSEELISFIQKKERQLFAKELGALVGITSSVEAE